MKTTYIIAIAVVVIVIIIGSVFAYTYVSSNSSKPSPTPSPTATATASPTAKPSASPTASPTAKPSASPTASPSPTPTASPAPTQLATASILGAGGTLVNPLMQTWISTYQLIQTKVSITYNAVGSGTGITQFQEQLTNFGESDVPLQASDIAKLPSGTTALTVPISASAVVPAYNIQLLNGSYCQNGLNFTGTVLANIFLGTVTKWDDQSIKNLQSTSVANQLPDATITVIHRSDSSGTMYAFTDYLSQASSTWNSTVGTSKKPAWPVGLGYSLNSGVAAGIIQNPDSIGPLEISYVLQNPGAIYFGAVQNAAGNYILPSVTTAQTALDAGATSLPAGDNMAAWSSVSIIDNIFQDTAATNAYPITTMTYALIYENQYYASVSAAQAAATVNFLYWIVNSGQVLGPNAGYVALPASIISIDDATLAQVTYNGSPITIIS